jgi:hypothetical protein
MGLTLVPKIQSGQRHRAEVLFTKEESAKIQTASKISGFTLTHLGTSPTPASVCQIEKSPSPRCVSNGRHSLQPTQSSLFIPP